MGVSVVLDAVADAKGRRSATKMHIINGLNRNFGTKEAKSGGLFSFTPVRRGQRGHLAQSLSASTEGTYISIVVRVRARVPFSADVRERARASHTSLTLRAQTAYC